MFYSSSFKGQYISKMVGDTVKVTINH